MSDDGRAAFGLELIDKVSGPAEKIIGGLEGASGALSKLSSTSETSAGGMSKLAKATEYMTFALRGIQIAHGVVELSKVLGGFGALRNGVRRAGQAVRQFGSWAAVGLRRIAPFAAGGAGLYGMGKIATGVAIPALAGTGMAITGVAAAAAAGAIAVGYLGLKLAGLAYDGLKAATEFATFGQNSRMAFNALAKHGASGNKLFEHARNLAVEYGQDVFDTTNNFKNLLAGGFNPRLATDILKMGGDLRFIGASAEQVKGAIRAINQIKAAGNLQGDELNQLSEAMIGKESVYDAIAAKIGKTRQEVMKLKEAGKLDSKTAIRGILDAVMATTGEKELGQRGKEWADHSIDGMVARVKARGQNFMQGVGDRMAPMLMRMAEGAMAWTEAFINSGRAEQLIGKIGDTLDATSDILVRAAPLAERFLTGFGSGATQAFDNVSRLLTALGSTDTAMLGATFEKVGSGLSKIIVYGSAAAGAIAAVVGALGTAYYWISPVSMFSKISLFYEYGKMAVMGVARGIRDAAMYPINAISDMANQMMGTLRSVMRMHSPSRAMAELGGYTAIGFAMGITALAPAAAAAGRDMALDTMAASDAAMGGAPVGAAPRVGGLDMAALARAGAITVSFGDIVVSASGGDANEIAAATSREVKRTVEAFFRQLTTES